MVYSKLVLSGGNLKGIAYIGVFKYLEEQGISNFTDISGTSVGSLFGLLLVLGYTPDELTKILTKFNFEELLGYDINSLLTNFGLDDGRRMDKFISVFLKNKGLSPDTTFKELYSNSGVNFCVNATCVKSKRHIEINHETYPEMTVALGVRASLSIPLIFVPVKYNNLLLVDGCLSSNLPVKFFKEPEENSSNQDDSKILCILLTSVTNEILEETTDFDLAKFITCLPRCSFSRIEENDVEYAKNTLKADILKLPLETEYTSEFKITQEAKNNLIQKGYNFTKEFFQLNS